MTFHNYYYYNNNYCEDKGNEYENKLNKHNNCKKYKKSLSIRYSMNHNNKSFYDNNTPPKKQL